MAIATRAKPARVRASSERVLQRIPYLLSLGLTGMNDFLCRAATGGLDSLRGRFIQSTSLLDQFLFRLLINNSHSGTTCHRIHFRNRPPKTNAHDFPYLILIGAGKSHETISYFFTTILPNGAKLAWAMLKQAMPNGIPIIVQHQRTPAIAEPSANQKPAKTIQIKFRKAVPTPAAGEGTSFFPNGQKANPAILKLAIPNGIPMIVQHQSNPTKTHASPSQIPPNANQRRLPINTILSPDFQRDTRNSSIGFLHNVFHSPSTQRITSQD